MFFKYPGYRIKVAIAENNQYLRNHLARVINSIWRCEVVLLAENARQLINNLFISRLPDIILMDMLLKDLDGFETCLLVKYNYPGIPILALSMYDDDDAIIKMLRNGAAGYVTKDAGADELKLAILQLIKGWSYQSEMQEGVLVYPPRLCDERSPDLAAVRVLKLLQSSDYKF